MLPIALFVREKSNNNILWNLVTILHIFTLLLTQSRSAYIVMIIIMIYYSAKNAKNFITNISLATFGILCFYMILLLFNAKENFVNRLLFTDQVESYSIRAEAFTVAYELLYDIKEVLLGLGPNMINLALKNHHTSVTT